MRGEIKSIHLIDYDDWQYTPDNPLEFCVAAEALIGPEGMEGLEIFSFEICSPQWFAKYRGRGATFIRHMLFVNEYDEEAIKNAVAELVTQFSAETWVELANRLARYMLWEFEDYQSVPIA